jgi:hypothetical protein
MQHRLSAPPNFGSASRWLYIEGRPQALAEELIPGHPYFRHTLPSGGIDDLGDRIVEGSVSIRPRSTATMSDAVKRLKAIASIKELGVGFTLATHDLEIRGAARARARSRAGISRRSASASIPSYCNARSPT